MKIGIREQHFFNVSKVRSTFTGEENISFLQTGPTQEIYVKSLYP